MEFLSPVREFFFLREAERTAAGYTPAQLDRVRVHFDAADARLASAREISSPRSAAIAAILLRESCALFLRAIAIAQDASAHDVDVTMVLDDVTGPNKPSEDLAATRDALLSGDPLFFDRMAPAELEQLRRSLEQTAQWLRERIEPRSRTNIRGTRYGRIAAVALGAAYLIGTTAWGIVVPTNLAFQKEVSASSRHGGTPDPKGLVDGVTTGPFGVHTRQEDQPWVRIDLGGTYTLDKIKVFNRGDGWFDECLPLLVEVSEDGEVYAELARRREHFDQNPPWEVDGRKTRARFVRLRSTRKTYIALSEVEVFGKK